MNKVSRRTPSFDSLESKVVLSTTHLAGGLAARAVAVHTAPLTGTVEYTALTGSGTSTLQGSGNISVLGEVSVNGSFTLNRRGGKGLVVLTGANGSLDYKGTEQFRHGNSAPKIKLTIVGGTGDFVKATGSAKVTLLGESDSFATVSIQGKVRYR